MLTQGMFERVRSYIFCPLGFLTQKNLFHDNFQEKLHGYKWEYALSPGYKSHAVPGQERVRGTVPGDWQGCAPAKQVGPPRH